MEKILVDLRLTWKKEIRQYAEEFSRVERRQKRARISKAACPLSESHTDSDSTESDSDTDSSGTVSDTSSTENTPQLRVTVACTCAAAEYRSCEDCMGHFPATTVKGRFVFDPAVRAAATTVTEGAAEPTSVPFFPRPIDARLLCPQCAATHRPRDTWEIWLLNFVGPFWLDSPP